MKKLTLLLVTFLSLGIMADDVSIKGAELKSDKGNEAKLSIKYVGTLNDNPKITVQEKILQVSIPNANLGTKISKKVNGAAISASQIGEDTTLRVVLPYTLAGKESNINITLKEGVIDVNFPRIETAKKVTAAAGRAPGIIEETPATPVTEVINAEADKLDENYLSKLAKDQEKLAAEKHPESAVKAAAVRGQADTDRVSLTQSGVVKETQTAISSNEGETKSRFSIAGYVGKFVAFMAIMIAVFYGVLQLIKKGVIKKGKLGFLHSTKLVEVLSTTHVAPKRSLIMIKAHKQVFLVSNSETGMQLISEIKDVTGLIKTGEEEITGSNFDTNLVDANKTEKQFKIKEDVRADDLAEDFVMDSLDDMLNDSVPVKTERKISTNAARAIEKSPVVDHVRFSDQIKTKVKNLKQL